VRPARPGESAELSALACAAKAWWGYAPEQLARWAEELRITSESIATQPTFVVEDNGRLVGVVQLGRASPTWALECLWVHPSALHRGVGSRLLRHALACARHEGQAELLIDADPNAEAFYLRCGARRVGAIAAPIAGEPQRVRPQLIIGTDGAAA